MINSKRSFIPNTIYLTLLLIFFSASLISQETTVEAFVDRNQVGENEIFRFNIEVKGANIGNVPIPNLTDFPFTVLGSSKSTSTSVSIVGNRQSTTRTERITYNLQTSAKGTFQIPPVRVVVNNQTFHTRPINITVVESTQQTQQQQQQQGRQQSAFAPRPGSQTQETQNAEMFFRATTDKTTAYRNEMIVVHYKLYTQYQLQNISLSNEPTYSGFWKEDLYQANRIQMQREVYDGKQFNTLLIRSVALFPSREGSLTITPFDLNIDIVIQGRSFFEPSQTRSIKVSSNPIEIRVNPLPAIEAEKNFIGAVGRFDVTSSISGNEGETGNSLTYRIILSGVGNFNQTSNPRIPDVQGLRFLTPEIEDTKEQSGTQLSGRRTFTYPILLQESGLKTIPEFEISWFDPAARRYVSRTMRSQAINIRQSDQQVISTPGGQQAIRVLGRDIEFIITHPSLRNHVFLHQSIWFWLALLALPLSLAVHYYFLHENKKLNSDLIYSRNRRASAVIRRYMKDANYYANKDSIEFYDSAYIGLIHFLTDKLNLSRGAVEKDIYQALKERCVKDTLISDLQTVLQKINFVKYSNSNNNSFNIKDDIGVINNLIQCLMLEFKNAKPVKKTRRKIYGFILFLMLFKCLSAEVNIISIDDVHQDDFVNIAIEHYQNNNFELALDSFLSAESAGLSNADLYFNIGNTYFRLSNIPYAIIYYKKALLLNSSHKEARQNLNFALTITRDRQNDVEENFMTSFLDGTYYYFSINTLLIFCLSILALIIIIIHIQWYFVNIDRTVPRFVNFVLLFLLLALSSLTISRIMAVKNNNEAVVVENVVYVYSGPNETFTRLFTIHEGTILKIQREEYGWTQITTLGGFSGWINSDTYKKISSL